MHAADSPAFKRINRAMLYGGFSAFALLYCVQPLMPELARQFALTPAQSSWSLSISTLTLALALLASGPLADLIGRKRLMTCALVGSSVGTLLTAFAQDYTQLLVLRALVGLSLGGMPAVAMAYLGEEIEAPSLGLSMGIYIGGTAVGGLAGRSAAAALTEHVSWSAAMLVIGAAGLYAAWSFWRLLPASTLAQGVRPDWQALQRSARMHLQDGGLRWLFALGFLLMGVFVSLFNYIGYRLGESAFGLGQTAIGSLSVLYVIGMFSAVWAGRLSDRIGRRKVLWIVLGAMLGGLLLTVSDSLPVVVAGMALFTFGFFASHSVASSWVARRARAPSALASALYLFFYYMGSSVIGSLSGLAWSADGWNGVVALLALTLAAAALIALRLRSLAPLPDRIAPVARPA